MEEEKITLTLESPAVEEGLIDSLGSLSDALNCLYELIEEKENSDNKEIPEDKSDNNTPKG